jgi:integrase
MSRAPKVHGPAPKRTDLRDPRLPLGEMFDEVTALRLWESLPSECRRDHFDRANVPDLYREAIAPTTSGVSGRGWTSIALNMRGLPEPMVWELAWLIHREVELGRYLRPDVFNSVTRTLRVATGHGGTKAKNARSIMAFAPEGWCREAARARMRGTVELGASNDAKASAGLKRFQDVLVYAYHRGEWWRLDVWNPVLDERVPRRPHEPQGRHVANFSHLTADWLREAAKWWLSICLETERYVWSSLKSRLDALKWLQRHVDDHGCAGPHLVDDPHDLRSFVRALADLLRAHRVQTGPTRGEPLSKNVRRQAMTAIEQFYRWMYDNREEASVVLGEPRWLRLRPEHAVLFRPEDKPRLTNKLADDLALEDEVVGRIAAGAGLLAVPKDEGGLGDAQAFHALMLLIRTGRRVNEVLLMDFDPLSPLPRGARGPAEADTDGFVARMRYQQTKVEGGRPASIPADAEVVSIIRAQQAWARGFMASRGRPGQRPRYLFLRRMSNRNGALPYPMATLHRRLDELTRRLGITDGVGRPVRIGKTHTFRHTRATNLLNAGVPLHVVMRHFGHVTPAMTMHYAKTLSETAEREFLRYKKVTADGRALGTDPADLYDVLSLDRRADRILPNGWCLLPPKQVCTKGNACLTCDKFVTDATYADELERQLGKNEALIESRKAAFLARHGSPMPEDNVWLKGRREECGALRKILSAVERADGRRGSAVRGAGAGDLPDPEGKDATP